MEGAALRPERTGLRQHECSCHFEAELVRGKGSCGVNRVREECLQGTWNLAEVDRAGPSALDPEYGKERTEGETKDRRWRGERRKADYSSLGKRHPCANSE